MSSSTFLLYVQTTGHVLAAATIAAPPPQDPKPEVLAGALLPVRYSGAPTAPADEVLVPADQLSVLSVDSQLVPIGNALGIFVDPQKTPLPLDPNLLVTSQIFSSNTDLTITFKPTSTATVSIWARVQLQKVGDPVQLAAKSRTATIDVTPTAAQVTAGSATFPLTLLPLDKGDYSTLVLVSGFMPSLKTATVS
jgi:hypothetical protein